MCPARRELDRVSNPHVYQRLKERYLIINSNNKYIKDLQNFSLQLTEDRYIVVSHSKTQISLA